MEGERDTLEEQEQGWQKGWQEHANAEDADADAADAEDADTDAADAEDADADAADAEDAERYRYQYR